MPSDRTWPNTLTSVSLSVLTYLLTYILRDDDVEEANLILLEQLELSVCVVFACGVCFLICVGPILYAEVLCGLINPNNPLCALLPVYNVVRFRHFYKNCEQETLYECVRELSSTCSKPRSLLNLSGLDSPEVHIFHSRPIQRAGAGCVGQERGEDDTQHDASGAADEA